jgi:EAL domain-containing protein (putative c-di-GMP-specific phosphodiesterase class I)
MPDPSRPVPDPHDQLRQIAQLTQERLAAGGSLCCHDHGPADDCGGAAFLGLVADLVDEAHDSDVRLDVQRRRIADVLTAQALTIALQPVIDLGSGEYRSLEALARFDATIGPPDRAFALAERVGLRRELELLALSKSIELVPRLRPEQSIAINVSPDVAFHVANHPPSIGLDRLILEVTEHAAVESYATLRSALAPLRQEGLRLAVDDAGAGFSSLRHIVELQPDIIKIDRSLVAGSDSDRARRTVIMTFVLMALDMQATVVAEGVETPAELSCVSGLGVDQAQGYLIGRPTTDLDLIDALRHAAERPAPPYPDLTGPDSPRADTASHSAPTEPGGS